MQSFSSEHVLNEHQKDCLLISRGQNFKLEKEFIGFKDFNRHIPVPFKTYADFEYILKICDVGIDNECFSYTKKHQDHVPCSFVCKVVCKDYKFIKNVVLYRDKNSIMCTFKEYSYCRKMMKKQFNKNLVLSVKANELFERSNICWICSKLIDGDNKVRDHYHITGKYRGASHWSCNINLIISKKVAVIFHNLKGYDSHLIFKELSKYDCKISGLEKYISFSVNDLVFIDSMLFMNSSLDILVKNLSDSDFKYLSEIYSGKKLELVKMKCVYPYEYFKSFKKFKESKLPDVDVCFSLLKDCGINDQ